MSYLLETLKKAGLPFSRPHYNKLEREKKVNPPGQRLFFRHNEVFGEKQIRIYTLDEIAAIVVQIKKLGNL